MAWLDDELRGTDTVKRETRRLVRRALAQKWLVLGITTFVAAGATARQARKRSSYTASVTFRIDENVSEEIGQVARPATQLREYILDTVLIHQRCQEIIKKHKLYPSIMRRAPRLATEELYNDLSVNVYRNYFLEQERTNRSAILEVRYVSNDATVAFDVVQDIAGMIREHQIQEGREAAQALAGWAAQAVSSARSQWETVSRQHSEKLAALASAHGLMRAQLLSELALLSDAVSVAAGELRRAEQVQATSAMRVEMESKRMGLSFALVDFEKPRVSTTPKTKRLLVQGALLFLVLLPIVAMTVGAFIPYVYDNEDVERMGLRALGHVPAFPGWQSGTLRARQAGERWVTGQTSSRSKPTESK